MDYIESNNQNVLEEAQSVQAFLGHPELYSPKAEFVNGLELLDVRYN